MKLCFPQYFESKSRFLSYTVVRTALVNAGHEVVHDMDGVDAVLFSMCDVMEYRDLMKMRKRAEGKFLIVGGAYAYNFWSAILYCDAVWVGEVYDMADCKTLDEILDSPHCYTGGDVLPVASQRIDWAAVPLAQIDNRRCYYWGGTGCKNHCHFCFTSWTHKHQVNDHARIQKAMRMAKKKKLHIMVSSNEYENDPGASTFDMMLKDYIKVPVKGGKVVRCGIEFPTDETRKKMGKPLTINDISKALQKAAHEKVSLRFFHITGYNDLSEWDDYINQLCYILDRINYTSMFQLGFNNLDYQNYVPLYKERWQIDPDKYSTADMIRGWRNRLRNCTPHVFCISSSSFQHACCRMGIMLSMNKDQVDFWTSMIVNPNKKLTVSSAYKALFDSKVFETPPLLLIPSTGEIRIHEPWRGEIG